MAGNGLMYTAQFSNVSITNAVQDIWQITSSPSASILVHSWRLTIVPTITSGVAQDVRINLQILNRTGTAGTGGTGVTPTAVNKRNSVAATSTWTRLVTTQASAGTILAGEQVSIIVPYERIYTPDQRVVLPAAPVASQTYLSLFLTTAPGAAYNASSEVYFEEI
jgi:hypothetical protein